MHTQHFYCINRFNFIDNSHLSETGNGGQLAEEWEMHWERKESRTDNSLEKLHGET